MAHRSLAQAYTSKNRAICYPENLCYSIHTASGLDSKGLNLILRG